MYTVPSGVQGPANAAYRISRLKGDTIFFDVNRYYFEKRSTPENFDKPDYYVRDSLSFTRAELTEWILRGKVARIDR